MGFCWKLIVSLCCLFIWTIGVSAQGEATPDVEPSVGESRVVATSAFLRAGPASTYDSVGSLTQGDVVVGIRRSVNGLWIEIPYARNTGWIFRDLVDWQQDVDALPILPEGFTPTPLPPPGVVIPPTETLTISVVVADTNVNVRSGPETSYLRLGSLRPGQQVTPIARNERANWVMVEFNDGFGWIATELVAWSVDLETLPIITVDSLTPSPEVTASLTPSVTSSSTVTSTPSPTTSPSATLSPTLMPTSTNTGVSSETPTILIPSEEPTVGLEDTATAIVLPTVAAVILPTLTPTTVPTNTATAIPSSTPAPTATLTIEPTNTPIPTETNIPTITSIPTILPTNTPTETITATIEPSPTATLTTVPSLTASATSTATFTNVPTQTIIPTNTETPISTQVVLAQVATTPPTETALAVQPTMTITTQIPPTPDNDGTPNLQTTLEFVSESLTQQAATTTSEALIQQATEIVFQSTRSPDSPVPTITMTPTLLAAQIIEVNNPTTTDTTAITPILLGAGGVLLVGYGLLFIRGFVNNRRYHTGFVVEQCPVCYRGELVVEQKPNRLLGIARPKRVVRCTECRSILREVGHRTWRYAVDGFENEVMFEQMNGKNITDAELQELNQYQ